MTEQRLLFPTHIIFTIRSFLIPYGIGMDEMEFQDARDNLFALYQDYQAMGQNSKPVADSNSNVKKGLKVPDQSPKKGQGAPKKK